MDDQDLMEFPKDKGYKLMSRPHYNSPGYTGLIIVLSEHPSDKYFQPMAMRIILREKSGYYHQQYIWWDTPLNELAHVCPGQLTLLNHTTGTRGFFTYGGSISRESIPSLPDKAFILRSPVPILVLSENWQTVSRILASETEKLIAEIKVKWEPDEEGFLQRVAEADPLEFYHASLQSIQMRYEDSTALIESNRDFYNVLCYEIDLLKDKHIQSNTMTTLEQLLHPPDPSSK